MESKRGRGRPRKAVSEAVMTERVHIVCSKADIAMIDALVKMVGSRSRGEAIRSAIRNEYGSLTGDMGRLLSIVETADDTSLANAVRDAVRRQLITR